MVDPEAMGGPRRDDEPDLEGEAGERLEGLTKAKTTQSQDSAGKKPKVSLPGTLKDKSPGRPGSSFS